MFNCSVHHMYTRSFRHSSKKTHRGPRVALPHGRHGRRKQPALPLPPSSLCRLAAAGKAARPQERRRRGFVAFVCLSRRRWGAARDSEGHPDPGRRGRIWWGGRRRRVGLRWWRQLVVVAAGIEDGEVAAVVGGGWRRGRRRRRRGW
jgi:hypothetical protein